MPIYAYRCSACGHSKDVLQKLSDPVLTTCPACSAEAFAKQLTAAGFQLKGSGWYATDFKSSGAPAAKPEGTTDADAGSAKEGAAAKPDAAGATSSGGTEAGGGTAAASGASSGSCGGPCACH